MAKCCPGQTTPTNVILGLCGRCIGTDKLVLTTGIFRPIFRSLAYFIFSALSTKHHTRICSPETTYDSFTHNTSLAPPPDLVYMTARTVQYEAHDEGTRDTLNDGVRTHISQRGLVILQYRSP